MPLPAQPLGRHTRFRAPLAAGSGPERTQATAWTRAAWRLRFLPGQNLLQDTGELHGLERLGDDGGRP